MNKTAREKVTLRLAISLVVLCILASAGIYAYTKLLKKTTADLLASVPAEATFVFQVNDNTTWSSSVASCAGEMEDFFSLQAMAGYEYFISLTHRNSDKITPYVISGHYDENGKPTTLFSMKMDEYTYKSLLKKLNINTKDHSILAGEEVYNIDTHYHNFKFVFRNGLFSASPVTKVLERSILCLANDQCLAGQKDFKDLQHVIDKNKKQNWLIVQMPRFLDQQLQGSESVNREAFQGLLRNATWSAYQVRFTGAGMLLSGYSLLSDGCWEQDCQTQCDTLIALPAALVPSNINNYLSMVINPNSQQQEANDTARSDYAQLNASEMHTFTWQADTLTSQYVLVKSQDSTLFDQIVWRDSAAHDSLIVYKNNNIYACRNTQFMMATPISSFHTPMTHFIQTYDYLLFAESETALKRWIDNRNHGKMLEQNQHYLFAKEYLPSDYACEFFYQNINTTSRKNAVLKTFMYSFKEPINHVLPHNIYIRFK